MRKYFHRWSLGGWLAAFNLLLVVLGGISAAYWTWGSWEANRVVSLTTTGRMTALENGIESSPAGAAPAVNAHLFGQLSEVQTALVSQRFKLVGTFFGWRERPEYALIAIDGGRPLPFVKGAEVVKGVAIREVAPEHILLVREGIVERLDMKFKR